MTMTPNRKIEKIHPQTDGLRKNVQNETTQKSQNSMPVNDNEQTLKSDWTPKSDPLIGKIIEGYSDASPGEPQSIMRFHIKELIGRGGMGVVYEIIDLTDPRVGHQRALKLLSDQAAADQGTVDRFKREIQATGKIDHPNVIKILAQGTLEDGRHFILMPLLDGQPLSELLKVRKETPMSAAEMLGIFIQMCDGLAAAHKVMVFHRDVKPGNTMILPGRFMWQHKVVIVDFGIAKLIPHGDDGTLNVITTTGVPFGTPSYMSPEQCQGHTIIDGRSDVYSTGCVMYEVLTGAPPFKGDLVGTLYQHLHADPSEIESVPSMSKSTAAVLNKIVLKALRKKPEERYQSIEELREALKEAEAEADSPVLLAKEVKAEVGSQSRKVTKALAKNIKTRTFSLFVGMSIAVIAIGLNVTPYIVTKDPTGSLTEIAWENVEPLPARTPEAFAVRKKQIFGLYNEEARSTQTPKGIPITPDAFTIMKDGGDLFFKNQKYKEALNLYKGAIDVGNFLVLKDIETQASNMGSACLSAAFCSLKLKDYRRAILYSKTGLEVAKKSSMRQDDQALFYGIQSVSNVGLGNKQEATSNATVFMAYLDKSEFKPEESYDIAPLVSVLGDFYLTTGRLDKAVSAYSKAQKAWSEFEDRGKYNEGVSDSRLGLIARDRARSVQELNTAVDLFEKAFALFPNQGTTSDVARARTKFYEASTYWQMKTWNGFLKALSVRKEAVDLWSELKKR